MTGRSALHAGRLLVSISFAASLGAGIYLSVAHLYPPSWFCLGIAGVTALGLLVRR